MKLSGNERGVVLLAVVFTMLVLALLTAGMNRRAAVGARTSAGQVKGHQMYLGQRAAIEHAKWKLKQDPAWRTDASGEPFVFEGLTYTLKVIDTVTPCHGDYIAVSAGLIQGAGAVAASVKPLARSAGLAMWRFKDSEIPRYAVWDGDSFGSASGTPNLGKMRIMAGAAKPTPTGPGQVVMAGVRPNGLIVAQMWDGTQWNVLPISPLNTTELTETYWWGCAVAYEQQSADALLVWNNNTAGSQLQYSLWNGTSWGAKTTVSVYGGAEPRQMRLVAKPGGDEMVLVVSDANAHDYALVWSGTDWGNALLLDASGTDAMEKTALDAAYQQQSGHAMVVYGKHDDPKVYHRVWNGLSWGFEQSLAPPSGLTAQPGWLTLASDPGSDRIVLGVLSQDGVWLNVWDGAAWGTSEPAESAQASTACPNVAVIFEAGSGQALATYGETGQTVVRYRTWDSCTGWSTEVSGPDIGAVPTSMTLAGDPVSDDVMLCVLDTARRVRFVLWEGASWGPVLLEEEAGEDKYQPFVFLYDR